MFRSVEVKTRCDAGDDSSDGFKTLQSNVQMEVINDFMNTIFHDTS